MTQHPGSHVSTCISNSGRLWSTVLVLVLAAGALLRLSGLDEKSISHPEIYVPGIDLIAGISVPPPRHELKETLGWHFHSEPHPIGYYVAGLVWTKLFGQSETALRLPSALFGIASVILIFVLSARIFGRRVGVVAALMLALHGYHVYWSQIARMYSPAVFVGLLATLLLVSILRSNGRRPGLESAYVLTTFVGVQTTELFWLLFAMHITWPVMLAIRDPRLSDSWPTTSSVVWTGLRISQLQALALAFCLPGLTHAVYNARRGAAPEPALTFLQEYFSFGFLFAKDNYSLPYLQPSFGVAILLVVSCLVLILAAMRMKPVAGPPRLDDRPLPVWLRLLGACAGAAVMFWLATIATRRGAVLMMMSALPILALTMPAIVVAIARVLARIGWVRHLDPWITLIALLGVVAPLLAYGASYEVSVLARRAFLILVPYILLLSAAGLFALTFKPAVRLLAVVTVAAIFASSAWYTSERPVSARDYKGLITGMHPLMLDDDMVFIRSRNWADTPVFYYLPDAHYVTDKFDAAVAENPDRRIWLITWTAPGVPPKMDARRRALSARKRIREVLALRASAELYATAEVGTEK